MRDQASPEPEETRAALAGALYANSYRTLQTWVDATAFRTHGFTHRSLGQSSRPRVADDFLVNSRFTRFDRETETSVQSYFFDAGTAMVSLIGLEDVVDGETLALGEGVRLRCELGEALGRRRSVRSYTGEPLPLRYLATILRAAAAVTGEATVDLAGGGSATIRFRTAPSGGGLYPIDTYVIALRVGGLERAVYAFDPAEDGLRAAGGAEATDELLACFNVPEEIISLSRAAAVLVFVMTPWRAMRKYGARGLRFALIEVGAIAENVHLAATALGIGSVDCASVYDDEVHETLGIDGTFRSLAHTIILGYAG